MKNINKLDVVLILFAFTITAVVMLVLPERVVIHVNAGNVPDGWGSKYIYFIIPAMYLIVWLIYYLTIPAYKISKEKRGMKGKDIARSVNIYKIFIHMVLLVLVGLYIYILFQVLRISTIISGLTSFVAVIAFVYLYVGFFVFSLTRSELLFLHWKEFKQCDTEKSFIIKKIFILIGCFVIALFLIFDALYKTVPLIIPIVLLGLLIIKFLYGFISKRNENLPTL